MTVDPHHAADDNRWRVEAMIFFSSAASAFSTCSLQRPRHPGEGHSGEANTTSASYETFNLVN